MIARTTRIVLEILAGFLALLTVAALVLIWRLSSGPVPANFLAPTIQSALERVATGYEVKVERIQLAWGGWEEALEFQALGLSLFDGEGHLAASLPRVAIDLSLRALLRGVLAPTSVAVYGARLDLERRADGSIGFGAETPQAGEADPSDLSPLAGNLLPELLAGRDSAGRFTYLERLAVRGARLRLRDRRLGLVWRAPRAAIILERRPGGLQGRARLDLDLAGDRAGVVLGLEYRKAAGSLDLSARLEGLKPASLAGMNEKLAFLGGIELPFDAAIEASLAPDGQVISLAFEARGRKGMIRRPDLFPEPLAAARATLAGNYDGASGALRIDTATLELGEPESATVLGGQARLEPAAAGRELSLDLSFNSLPVADLQRYWPLPVSPNGKSWVVENITEGLARDGAVAAKLLFPPGEEPKLEELSGGFAFEGLAVHYLRPMPPVTDLSGKAELNPDSLRFLVEKGRAGELAVTGGTVEISKLSTPSEIEQLSVEAEIEGPLPAALGLLDHPRLALISNLGLKPGEAAGTTATRLALALPLKKELAFQDVEISAKSKISEAEVRNLLPGKDMTEGTLALAASQESMELSGALTLAGVPLEGRWRESFRGKGPAHRLDLKVKRLDDGGRAAFGLGAGAYLTGPLSGSLSLVADRSGEGQAEVSADLTEVRLALPFIGWDKPRGTEGQADALLQFSKWQPRRLGNLKVKAPELALAGEILFREGAFAKASLKDVEVGRSRVKRLEIEPFGDGGVAARTAGGVLDLSGLQLRGGTKGTGVGRPALAEAEEGQRSFLPIHIEAQELDRLLLGPDRLLENVTVELLRQPDGWRRITARGEVPRTFWRHAGRKEADDAEIAAKRFSFDYGPEEDGYRLSFLADDMGAVLRALGILKTMEGGRLDVRGHLPGPLPHAPLEAEIESDAFRIVEAPILGRILTLASFVGIADALRGEGIAFDRLTGAFRLEKDIATTDLLRAYGSALGITAKGQVDIAGSGTDLAGTVVPAYTINRVLGQIPLLGRIITGGEGEGVLAITYSVKGPIDAPEVSVNPLSALAPGFLRGIFGLVGGGGEESEVPTALPRGDMER